MKINKIVFEAFKHEDKLKLLVKHLSQAIEFNKDHIEIINSLPVKFKFLIYRNIQLLHWYLISFYIG